MPEKGAAEGALSGALANLFAVAEDYPQLKANENFRSLQDELQNPGKLRSLRRGVSSTTPWRNTTIAIQQFPAVLFAGMFGFTAAPMFKLEEARKRK